MAIWWCPVTKEERIRAYQTGRWREVLASSPGWEDDLLRALAHQLPPRGVCKKDLEGVEDNQGGLD